MITHKWIGSSNSQPSQSWPKMCCYFCYFRFSHDITKIQTKKLLILLSFYFHEVLQYPNFWFEKFLRFAIEDAWISRLLGYAAFRWRPGELLCGLKTILTYYKYCFNLMSSWSDEFTHLWENLTSCRCFCWFPAAIFVPRKHVKWTPTWRLHTKLYRLDSWRVFLFIHLLSFPRFWTFSIEWFAFLF